MVVEEVRQDMRENLCVCVNVVCPIETLCFTTAMAVSQWVGQTLDSHL